MAIPLQPSTDFQSSIARQPRLCRRQDCCFCKHLVEGFAWNNRVLFRTPVVVEPPMFEIRCRGGANSPSFHGQSNGRALQVVYSLRLRRKQNA